MINETDIVELELRSKRFSLAVRKKEALEAAEPTIIYQVSVTGVAYSHKLCHLAARSICSCVDGDVVQHGLSSACALLPVHAQGLSIGKCTDG